MKFLCLADLHRDDGYPQYLQQQDADIAALLRAHRPDAVLLAGDIFESSFTGNPYAALAALFPERPVLCVLGNHEFWNRTVAETQAHYRRLYAPDRWPVHYLDVVGGLDLGDHHFLGNVLWYDGSTATTPDQRLLDFAGGGWPDTLIKSFDPLAETAACQEQIRRSLPRQGQVGVLLTHCVPHRTLNAHLRRPNAAANPFNAYSGLATLLDDVRCAFAVSGHTHLPVPETVINGCRCWNIGNDIFPPLRYVVLDTDTDAEPHP